MIIGKSMFSRRRLKHITDSDALVPATVTACWANSSKSASMSVTGFARERLLAHRFTQDLQADRTPAGPRERTTGSHKMTMLETTPSKAPSSAGKFCGSSDHSLLIGLVISPDWPSSTTSNTLRSATTPDSRSIELRAVSPSSNAPVHLLDRVNNPGALSY